MLIATIITFVISFILTSDFNKSFTITLIDRICKFIAYYGYEVIYNKYTKPPTVSSPGIEIQEQNATEV